METKRACDLIKKYDSRLYNYFESEYGPCSNKKEWAELYVSLVLAQLSALCYKYYYGTHPEDKFHYNVFPCFYVYIDGKYNVKEYEITLLQILKGYYFNYIVKSEGDLASSLYKFVSKFVNIKKIDNKILINNKFEKKDIVYYDASNDKDEININNNGILIAYVDGLESYSISETPSILMGLTGSIIIEAAIDSITFKGSSIFKAAYKRLKDLGEEEAKRVIKMFFKSLNKVTKELRTKYIYSILDSIMDTETYRGYLKKIREKALEFNPMGTVIVASLPNINIDMSQILSNYISESKDVTKNTITLELKPGINLRLCYCNQNGCLVGNSESLKFKCEGEMIYGLCDSEPGEYIVAPIIYYKKINCDEGKS